MGYLIILECSYFAQCVWEPDAYYIQNMSQIGVGAVSICIFWDDCSGMPLLLVILIVSSKR